uniref:Uncharacterized protein n=1 Tax=Pipistrellus kuhlii TaxID=59472 RepID=A0A7J7S5D8_PIPKU|nr:hypothetical protein mPipKuh1_000229 [Pipistrellus kuhlii]
MTMTHLRNLTLQVISWTTGLKWRRKAKEAPTQPCGG